MLFVHFPPWHAHLPPKPCPFNPHCLSPVSARSFQVHSLASHSNHVLSSPTTGLLPNCWSPASNRPFCDWPLVSCLQVPSSPITCLTPQQHPLERSYSCLTSTTSFQAQSLFSHLTTSSCAWPLISHPLLGFFGPNCSSPTQRCPFECNCSSPASTRPFRAQVLASYP